MPTLTTPQVAELRALTGDVTEPFDVDTATLNLLYNDAGKGAEDLERTAVFVLRRRWAIHANRVSVTTDGTTVQGQQRAAAIKRLLDYYETLTGLGVSGWGAGTLTFGIDTDWYDV